MTHVLIFTGTCPTAGRRTYDPQAKGEPLQPDWGLVQQISLANSS